MEQASLSGVARSCKSLRAGRLDVIKPDSRRYTFPTNSQRVRAISPGWYGFGKKRPPSGKSLIRTSARPEVATVFLGGRTRVAAHQLNLEPVGGLSAGTV